MMSTRCQIGFYEKGETDLNKWEALLYRHSDGYQGTFNGIEYENKEELLKNLFSSKTKSIKKHCSCSEEYGVLADIVPFLRKFDKKRGLDDIEYASARLLQFLCNEYDKEVKYRDCFAGYGICSGFHGDIEYYYAIFPDIIKVYHIPFDNECESWELINIIEIGKEK